MAFTQPQLSTPYLFQDRQDAGKQLASQLKQYIDESTIVLALPKGGVEVGFEVAHELQVPLHIIISRKIGAPYDPELGIGAVSEHGVVYLDQRAIQHLDIPKNSLQLLTDKAKAEVHEYKKLFRGGNDLPPLEKRAIILVDDGLATGVTALAAIKSILSMMPQQLIFAAPVCAYDSALKIETKVDSIVCVSVPYDLESIGRYYKYFPQTSIQKVIHLLKKSHQDIPEEVVH
jgi:putative phosphoribosyl transferase